MKNRVFAFVLVIIIFPFLLIPVNASAVSSNGGYLDVLSYSLPNNNPDGLMYQNISSGDSITFDLPYSTSFYDIDMLIRCDLNDLQVFVFNQWNVEYQLNVTLIDDSIGKLYRVYGSCNGQAYQPLGLRFNFSSGSVVFFEQLKLWTLPIKTYSISANGHVDMGGSGVIQPANGNFTWDPNDFVQVRKNNTDEYYYAFEAKINLIDWYKYDFININGQLSNCYISSISSEFGFPIEVDYSLSTGMDKADTLTSYDISLDLRDIPRDTYKSESITIIISGTLAGISDFYIWNMFGLVSSSQNSFLYSIKSFFNNLSSTLSGWLQNIYNAIVGDSTNAANDFNDSVSDQNDQLDQMVDDMTAATLPDIDDIEIDIDNVGADVNNAGDVLALPLQNTLIFRVFFIAATFAMGGYVLYGKR